MAYWAVQVVGGAVERVDNPFVFGFFGAATAAFFGGDFMLGIGFLQDFADDFFGSAVYVGNEVVEGFAVDFHGGQVVAGTQHHVAGAAGGFDSGVEDGIHISPIWVVGAGCRWQAT